jgi:hypothetical protein
MKNHSYLLIFISLAVILQSGCGRSNPAAPELSDDEAINLLISSSNYADYSNYTDDGLSEFIPTYPKSDSFPSDIFFRRRIEARSHNISIIYDSSRTFATALIATDFTGRLVLDNNQNGVCDSISRPIHDQGLRYVWFRKWNDRWRVYGASPMVVQTADPANKVSIDSIRVEGDLGLRTRVMFNQQGFGQMLRREEMPIFYQGAKVTLTVWASLEQAPDSCWAFMHRRVLQNGVTDHLRVPMLRQSGFEFSFCWTVDAITAPVVRHAAIDVLLGSTLFGDSTAEYSACIWTLPYIVTNNDSLPK